MDSREASLAKPETLDLEVQEPEGVEILEGFTGKTEEELESIHKAMELAMSLEDLAFCRDYFRDEERRDPTVTEIRVIDTYWSDHCRHTTFLTKIEEIKIPSGYFNIPVHTAFRLI